MCCARLTYYKQLVAETLPAWYCSARLHAPQPNASAACVRKSAVCTAQCHYLFNGALQYLLYGANVIHMAYLTATCKPCCSILPAFLLTDVTTQETCRGVYRASSIDRGIKRQTAVALICSCMPERLPRIIGQASKAYSAARLLNELLVPGLTI